MALANRKSEDIFNKNTGANADAKSITDSKELEIKADFEAGVHIADEGMFNNMAPALYAVQQVADDIAELRRFIASELTTYSANDISTWQLQSETFYVGSTEPTPEAIFFKPDGTKMYILCRSGDDINEYALSTAWDVSTASRTDALTGLGSSPASEPNPYGMYISPDGIYLYIVGHSTDQVVQYTMSTAWDISTASYTREQGLTDAGGTFVNPTGVHFKPDGTMFWACSYDEDTIQQYTLSTAWDVSTLSTGHSFSLRDFFILNDFNHEGAIGDIGSSEDLFFSEDGTKVWFVENGYDSVHQLKLSTAWDIRTAAYDGKGIRHSMFESVVEGIYVNETAGKAFTVSTSSDRVRSFNFGGNVFSSQNNTSIGFDCGVGVKGNASFSGATSFVDITTQQAYVYGSFGTYSTTNLTHGNGGTVNILDGTVYSGDATLDVMTNVYYGASNSDLSVQDTYIHNMNFGRPRGGAKVTLNIGRRVGPSGDILNHTGVMDVVSMAQTFDHYGSLDVGRTLQVDGKADLEVFDLGGTVVFNDTFTETNTTAIESHKPDLGAGWTKVFDTGATTTFNIIGGAGYGQLSNSETSDGVMFLADTTPTGVDYEVRVDFKRRDSSDDVFLIIIKYQDANNYYALQWSASYSTYCRLFKVEGGSLVNVESNFNYGAMNSTTDNLSTALKLRFIDNTLMVWDIDSNDYKSFRGSYPVTTDFNDGNGGTYHKVGMAFGDLLGGSLDATATWKIDKFEVKMLSSAATLAAATKSYIDAGNLGIGTTSPGAKLHTIPSGSIGWSSLGNAGILIGTNTGAGIGIDQNEIASKGDNLYIGTITTNTDLILRAGGTTNYLTLDSSAGTIEAAKNINVTKSSATVKVEESGGADVRIVAGGATGYIGAYSNDTLQLMQNGSAAVTIDTSKNVGIGTTSPDARLEINTAATSDMVINANERLKILGDGTMTWGSSSNFGQLSWDTGYALYRGLAGKGIKLQVDNTSTAMTLTTDGKVGIGTTSPGNKLEVNSGTTNVAGVFKSSDNQAWISVQDDDSGTYGALFGTDSDAGHDIILADSSANKRLVVDSSGNVGIGTTSPSTELQLGDGTSSQQLLLLGPNGAANSSEIILGDSNTESGPNHAGVGIRYNSSSNILTFRSFFSGSSQDVSMMTLVRDSGNVGIGTTSPSAKLEVRDGSVVLRPNTAGGALTWRESDNGNIGGQLRSYANRGDIYLYNDGVKTTEISSLDDSFIPRLHIGGTNQASAALQVTGNIAVSGSVQRQISTTHHTININSSTGAGQDFWIPFIEKNEQPTPNITHKTVAPYDGVLKRVIVHSTVAFASNAQIRFHKINNGAAKVFANDNSTDDLTTNVTADMSTAYASVAFNFTSGNSFRTGDQIGLGIVRNNTAVGDVVITAVWEYELF